MKCGGKCTVLIRRAMPKKLSAGAISTFSWCLVHQLLVRSLPPESHLQPFESHPLKIVSLKPDMSASKITQHEFDTTTRVCKHCAKDSKAATATNCFERSIEASMDLVATLVKQLQIGQEEIRKSQEEDRKRQEEDRERQEEDRKRLQTVVEGVEGLKAGMLGGVFHSDILIQTEIPAEIRQRHSIHGSWVGTNTKEGKAITTFISNQVLGLIDYTWKVNLDEFASVDQEVKNFADFTQHSDLYAALNVENDNQYNIKVNIQDSKKNVVHLTTRPEFLILPKAYATKNQRLDQVYLQTILFVEVISGQKTEDESLRQLLTTLRAVAAHTAKHARLYGIVVDKHFTQARLVKYQFYACFSDGTFHPSRLHGVCEMLLRFQ
eukprot:g47113.t1